MGRNYPSEEEIKLAEASFKTVLDADVHEDNKANRILTAIAFLTTAATFIFNAAYAPRSPTEQLKQTITQLLLPYVNTTQITAVANNVVQSIQVSQLTLCGLNAPLVFFTLYMFFVLLGAIFYLGALGPSLNLPKSKPPVSDDNNKPLLFFRDIARKGKEEWKRYWEVSCYSLLSQMKDDYIRNSWSIAQKANAKVTLMSYGSRFFKPAIAFLILLVSTLFSSNISLSLFFGGMGLYVLSVILYIIGRKQPLASGFYGLTACMMLIPIAAWLLFFCSNIESVDSFKGLTVPEFIVVWVLFSLFILAVTKELYSVLNSIQRQ